MMEDFYEIIKILESKALKEEQKIQMIGLILDKDPNVIEERRYFDKNMAILHYATDANSPEVIQYLLERGADPMAKDSEGDLPIHHAIICNFPPRKASWAVVKVFLKNGVNVNIKGHNENTALHYAATIGNLEIVSKLIEEYNACVNVGNDNGETPLHYAAISGDLEVVNKLIECGAKTYFDQLHYAAAGGNINIIKKFFNGINLNISYGDCMPLHYICYDSPYYNEIIKMFCEHGADLNVLDEYLDTILLLSILNCKTTTVEYLLNHGADVNNKRLREHEESYEGEFEEEKELYRVLIKKIGHQSDSRYKDIFKLIALHIAKLEAAELEISNSNLQLRDEFKNSVLFIRGENQYRRYLEECKEEIKKLKEKDVLLYNLLKEDDIRKQINIWIKRKSKKVSQNGKKQKIRLYMQDFKSEVEETYQKYSGIIIYKINQIEKEIFTRNNKPLINALSRHYGWGDLQNVSYRDLATFLIDNKDYLTEKLRKNGLILGNSIDIINCNDYAIASPCSLRTLAAAQYISSYKFDHPNVQKITCNAPNR